MMNICLRYANDKNHAHDLFQEGFVNVLLNLKKFKFKSSLETWMIRIFINVSLASLKKQNYVKQLFFKPGSEELENIKDDVQDFEHFDKHLGAENILELLNKLPKGYKTIINLYMFDNYNHKEIARKLKISETTSRSQFFKAKKYLKNLILNYTEKFND